MALFSERRIEQHFADNDQSAIAQLNPLVSKMPLPAEERITQAIASVAKQFEIGLVSIEPERITNEVIVEQIPGSRIDPFRFPDINKTYPHAAVLYKIPVKGNSYLLRCSPRTFTGNPSNANLGSNVLTLKIGTQYANENLSAEVEAYVKREVVTEVERIQTNIKQLNLEVEEYNKNLLGRLNSIIQEKITSLKAKTDREGRLNPFA